MLKYTEVDRIRIAVQSVEAVSASCLDLLR